MAKYLINLAKPNIIYRDTPEWERATVAPLDKNRRPIPLPYDAEQRRLMILKLGKDKKAGEPIEVPTTIPAFECGDAKYTVDPKDPKNLVADKSGIREYPEIKMGEIMKFNNEQDAIDTMMRIRFLHECDEKGAVIKMNREGAKYHQLLPPEETKELLKTQKIKWETKVREAEKGGIV